MFLTTVAQAPVGMHIANGMYGFNFGRNPARRIAIESGLLRILTL